MVTAIKQFPQSPDVEPVEVDLRKSYVAGGNGYYWGAPGVLSSQPSDAFTLHLDQRTHELMKRDPDVWAALLWLKIRVLIDPLVVESCVAKEEEEGFEIAKANAELLKRSIMGMRTPLRRVFEEMLDALSHGHKIAEVTLKDGAGLDRGKLVLDSIKVKPQGVVRFVVDLFWNVLGFIPGLQPTMNQREVLPREKFFVLSLHTQDSDPRGQSSTAPAYDSWCFKQKLWPIYLRWLHQCAIPGLIGETAANDKAQVQKINGKVVTDSNGNPIVLTAEEAMLAGLLKFENGSAVVVKNGASVKPIEVQGTGEQFERGLTVSGKQTTRAILLQELATTDAAHQTKGSTESQITVVDDLVAWLKGELVEAFMSDVATPLLRVNQGDAALEYMPHFSLGDSTQKDWAEDSKAVVALIEATTLDEDGNVIPALTASQIQSLLRQVSVPAPTDEEIAERQQRAVERRKIREQQQQGQPPANNQPPANGNQPPTNGNQNGARR